MRLECPKCEASVHVSPPEDGKRVKCPACGARFLPPVDEDDDEPDEAPRRSGKKGRKKSKFPLVPVAIVGVGVLALGVVALVLLLGNSKKPNETASNGSNSGVPQVVQAPPPIGLGTGGRPEELPPEVVDVFSLNDNPNAFPPPAPIVANLIHPLRGATKLTVSLPALAQPEATGGKLTREEVEKASVYVKVRLGLQGGSGSGFLIRAEPNEGLIATNFHVVEMAAYSDQGAVSVVFDSGLKTEVEYPAEIVGAEPMSDLAILRIARTRNLPKPLEPRFLQSPKATQEVLIYGFPLGQLLATGGRNPAITIGKGAISSLRRGDDGEIQQLQIDGNINPGNSGGPIVDADGRLVGITVAKIRDDLGTGIGFAIPAAKLVSALNGRVVFPSFQQPVIRDDEALLLATVPFSDPLKQMKSASLLVWSGSGEAPQVGRTATGWKPMPGATSVMISTPVKGLARAELRLPANQGNLTVAFQTVLLTNAGETIVSAPVEYQLKVEPRSLVGVDMQLSEFVNTVASAPGIHQGKVFSVRGLMTGQPSAVWDKTALALTDETGKALPANWLFLANGDFANHLKNVTFPVGKGVPVRLALRVGRFRMDMGPVLRVIRVDFMDGTKISRTVPPLSSVSFVDSNALASLNQSPKAFAGRDVIVEARMSMNLRGTPQDPQFTFFLPTGEPAANAYFTSSLPFANAFRAVDLAPGSVDRVRATVRVESDRNVIGLPMARVTRIEFLSRDGELLKTLE